MANKRISSLDPLATPAVDDIIPVTDISDTTGSPQGTTKKVTVADLLANAPDNSTDVTLSGTPDYITISGQTITRNQIDLAADVTGLLPNASVDGLGTAATQDVGTSNGNVVQLDATGLPAVDGSQLTNVSGTDSTKLAIANNLSDLNDAATARTNLGLGTAATTASTDYATASHTHAIDDLSDVDTSTTAPTTNDFLKWGGSNWVPAVPTADVDGPLTIALRGTDNPHIGAYPQQSFKVMDNPTKSAMVIADADGNVTYVLKDTTSQVKVQAGSDAPTRFALATDLPAFILENDSGEPDIEVTDPNTGKKISVISGDGDEKGANNLPTIQGYITDIGGNPSPLLISGGTIA